MENKEAQVKIVDEKVKLDKKSRKKSFMYENLDVKVETMDKILIILFIIIVIVFGYAVMY